MGIILATAGLVTLLFRKIGQPVVLGYLIAGVLVGPEFSYLPTVQEKDAIRIWAEIGVIVLLFGLGLEFSFKKLLAVGRGATITALTEILCMLGIGYLVGQAFGWSSMDSLFLGGMLSISSTTIIIRAFDELGMRQRRFVQLVFGVLIIEDLAAILLLVLLSTIAVTHSFEGAQLVGSTAKLAFFLSLWFLGGIFLVPWFLRRVRPLMNDETSLIVSLGLCLSMVILATHAGFSPALGAFVMGSILAETKDAEKIEHNLKPVRDLFAAIFFVSVGMLIEVQPIREHWVAVLVLTVVTIVGKFLSTFVGALMGGQSIRTSVQSGMSLAQIGEFSFIIATLGLSLKVISEFLYPLAVAISAVTTLTTPYMIRASGPFYDWLKKRLPTHIQVRAEDRVQRTDAAADMSKSTGGIFRVFLNSVIVIAFALASRRWLMPHLEADLGLGAWASLLAMGTALILSLPSLWAIVNGTAIVRTTSYRFEDVRDLTSQALLIFIARVALALFLLGFVVAQFISALMTMAAIVALAVLIGFLGARNFTEIYGWFEKRFLEHMSEKKAVEPESHLPALAPWEAHLSQVLVAADSQWVGKRLAEIGVREKFGVTIAMIERGRRKILAPRRDEWIMAHDRLVVIGSDDQLSAFAAGAEAQVEEAQAQSEHHYQLGSLRLTKTNPWVGRSIRESGIREATDGLVVGLERGDARMLNPDSSITLKAGDIVWLVGDQNKIKQVSAASDA